VAIVRPVALNVLLGVAATRVKDFVDEIVPGFKKSFRRAENAKSVSGTGTSH
jgi:hypothetical protein